MFKWLRGKSEPEPEHVEPAGDLSARKIPGGLEIRGINMTTPFSFVLPGQNITSQGMVMTDTGRAVVEAEQKNDEIVFDIDGRRISFSSHVIGNYDKFPVLKLIEAYVLDTAQQDLAGGYEGEKNKKGEYKAKGDPYLWATPKTTRFIYERDGGPVPWYIWHEVRYEPATKKMTNAIFRAVTLARPRIIVLRSYLDRGVDQQSIAATSKYLRECAKSLKRGAELTQSQTESS